MLRIYWRRRQKCSVMWTLGNRCAVIWRMQCILCMPNVHGWYACTLPNVHDRYAHCAHTCICKCVCMLAHLRLARTLTSLTSEHLVHKASPLPSPSCYISICFCSTLTPTLQPWTDPTVIPHIYLRKQHPIWEFQFPPKTDVPFCPFRPWWHNEGNGNKICDSSCTSLGTIDIWTSQHVTVSEVLCTLHFHWVPQTLYNK